MQLESRSISQLVPNPINVRRHNKNQINEFKKSIDKFGVLRPIIIDENNVILAGHGLFEALKQQGAEEVEVKVMYNLSDADKKKLLLADNKIYSLGIDDYTAIENILQELGESQDFDIPGYDADTLEDLYGIASIESDVEQKEAFNVSSYKRGILENEENERSYNPEPSKQVQQARQEAKERKFVVCPSCGEKIWL